MPAPLNKDSAYASLRLVDLPVRERLELISWLSSMSMDERGMAVLRLLHEHNYHAFNTDGQAEIIAKQRARINVLIEEKNYLAGRVMQWANTAQEFDLTPTLLAQRIKELEAEVLKYLTAYEELEARLEEAQNVSRETNQKDALITLAHLILEELEDKNE